MNQSWQCLFHNIDQTNLKHQLKIWNIFKSYHGQSLFDIDFSSFECQDTLNLWRQFLAEFIIEILKESYAIDRVVNLRIQFVEFQQDIKEFFESVGDLVIKTFIYQVQTLRELWRYQVNILQIQRVQYVFLCFENDRFVFDEILKIEHEILFKILARDCFIASD